MTFYDIAASSLRRRQLSAFLSAFAAAAGLLGLCAHAGAVGGGVIQDSTITVTSFTVTPTTVLGGATVSGTITISSDAPTGGQAVAVTVPVSESANITVPPTVTVPAGDDTVTFNTIATTAVTIPIAVSITATIGTSTQEATLTIVNPGGTSYGGYLQFFSVPYSYQDLLSNIFSIEPTSQEVAFYDPATIAYTYQADPYDVTLQPGLGYWSVFASTGADLLYLGAPASNALETTITLSAGWNGIGDPYAVPINIADLTFTKQNLSFAQATSAGYYVVSPTLYFFLQDPSGFSGTYGATTTGNTLYPGLGYWIYAYNPTTLNYVPPGLPATGSTGTSNSGKTPVLRRHY